MKMIVVYQTDLFTSENIQWDGVLGLSPTSADESDSFVQMMKHQNIIDTASFGVYYDDTASGSEITFGGIDTDIVPSFDKLTFTDLCDSESWSVNIKSMRYGDTKFNMQPRCGIIDTGKSVILLPSKDYKAYEKVAQNNKTCYK